MIPDRVFEGDEVTLKCITSCHLTGTPTFTWYKHGRNLPYIHSFDMLRLSSVSQEDAGDYRCSIQEHSYRSPAMNLDVLSGDRRRSAGVVSQPCCSVYCTISPICALKGSTVTMGCRYTYPYCYQVQRVFWSREWIIDREPSDLSLDPNYIHRCQYHRNSFYEYTLSLSDVTEHDQGFYYCTFIPMTGGNNPCQVGVELFVSELRVEIIPDRVVEGDEVTLTCKTTCSLSYMSTFTWYKQGSQLSQSSNLLHLPSVSQKDAGSYSCSVHGQYYHSPGVTLDVQYPPKSVSVSINPSGEIVEGSSVILICNSNAYPPVHSYTWYRAGSSVGTGNTFVFIRIKSEDSGDYACRAENKHGEQSSSAVSLIVLYPPKSVSVSISPSGEIVKESSVTLTCSSDANPPVHSYTWYKLNESSPVGSGQSYSFTLSSSSSGWFYCEAKNKLRKLQVEMISDRVVEGDKVTLTCRTTCRLSDTPKFNWYKQGHQLTLFYSFDRLVLQPVSQRDAGSYSCSINGQGYQSPEVTLDVQYPPKSVSVSISPYDEIVEGSSVTLNCSSDANPPIHSYIWYKDGSSVETGDTFIIIKVRSEDSGDYTCKAENKHGQQSSTAMSLNVLYPPKNISVSISPSDEIVKGSSVNLTCSSDANPPVHNYTWYKVDEISPVGSGQSYSFTLSSSSSGWFYCEAQNKLGTVVNQDDVQYASIQHRTAGKSVIQALSSETAEEVQYATVQHRCDRAVKQTQEADDLYANVRLKHSATAYRLEKLRVGRFFDHISINKTSL
ncbi:B-cell receptor CD22 [Bagarius yarrelli]|uniref:B-cell receptor CD22 n=1 Tax=Bagarius yarrelli TaxID=175774 RepID=A0A556TL82_BAGYA|nr:B-cell receptor CD22 [Bagarius yarrelli]